MPEFISIKVECYSGYKPDEYPKSFAWNNKNFIIREITDRWYQGESNPGIPIADYFKVKTDSGELFMIKHDIQPDQWFLCISAK